MSVKRKSAVPPQAPVAKKARLSPISWDGDQDSTVFPENSQDEEESPESEWGEGDSNDSRDENDDDDDDKEEEKVDHAQPAYAQFEAESDVDGNGLSESGESGSEDMDELHSRKSAELASLPMGALLKAQRQLASHEKRKVPAPLPMTTPEVAKKGRARASKSGRAQPRYAHLQDDKPLPSFLTGANAAPPGAQKEKREKKEIHGRDTKHGPAVMSSKRAVGRARQIVDINKIDRRDPRFDTLSGAFDEHKYKKAYAFLDEQRLSELADLRKQITAKSSASMTREERERQQRALTRLESQLAARRRQEQEQAVLSAHRKEERARRTAGKAPYHLKRADEKALLTKAREEQLVKEGKLQKSIRKKEMKEAQKEKRRRPDMRRIS